MRTQYPMASKSEYELFCLEKLMDRVVKNAQRKESRGTAAMEEYDNSEGESTYGH